MFGVPCPCMCTSIANCADDPEMMDGTAHVKCSNTAFYRRTHQLSRNQSFFYAIKGAARTYALHFCLACHEHRTVLHDRTSASNISARSIDLKHVDIYQPSPLSRAQIYPWHLKGAMSLAYFRQHSSRGTCVIDVTVQALQVTTYGHNGWCTSVIVRTMLPGPARFSNAGCHLRSIV